MLLAAVLAERVQYLFGWLKAGGFTGERVRPAAAGAFPQDDAAADADDGLKGSELRRLH